MAATTVTAFASRPTTTSPLVMRSFVPMRTRRRSALPMLAQVATCVALAAGYFKVAWSIVFSMRIGATVGSAITADRGVHSGDLLAIPIVLFGLISLFFATGFYARWERSAA